MKDLFKYFIGGNEKSIVYIQWFVKQFPYSEFSGIDKILYFFLEYCNKLSVAVKRTYLEVFLKTELEKIVKKYNIHIDSLTANYNYDEIAAFKQAVQIISVSVLDTFDNYIMEEVEDYEDFKVNIRAFMMTNLQQQIVEIYTKGFTDMNQGADVIDISDSAVMYLSNVRNIYNVDAIADIDFLLKGVTPSSREPGARFISHTGLPCIDNDYGGIYSKALVTGAGQPGYGKTRFFLAHYAYPVIFYAKKGVLYTSLELEEYEIRNILLSIHIANMYKVKIPDRDINRNNLTSEQKRIVESARIDLFESGKYGRFICETDALYVEEMKTKMKSFIKINKDIEVWIIDYLGWIKSKRRENGKSISRAEIIDEALVNGKEVAKLCDICTVGINQYNEAGNDAADLGKPITHGMIQGGQSIQRHSDFDLAITATLEQFAAQIRDLSTTKVRAAVGFRNVTLEVDMAISRFTQRSKIEMKG